MRLTYAINDKIHEFDISAQPAGTIGRSRSNTLKIRDHNISRTHLKFDLKDGCLRVTDQDSRNGLFVNGLRVTEAELKAGDEFSLGALKLRFEEGSVTPGSSPSPAGEDTDDGDGDEKDGKKGVEFVLPPRKAADPEAETMLEQRGAMTTPAAANRTPSPTPSPKPRPATPQPAAQPPAAAVDPSRVPLLLIKQDGATGEFAVRFQRVSIGVSPDNDLVLSAGKVSRYHAEIRQVDQLWIVRDLGSKNGTLLNDHKIEEAVLNDGDRLEIGMAILTFKWSAQASAAGGKRGSSAIKLGVIGTSSLLALVGIALLVAPFMGSHPKTPAADNSPKSQSEAEQYVEFLSTGMNRLKEALEDGKFDSAKRNFGEASKLRTDAQPLADLTEFLEKHLADRSGTPWAELSGLMEKARKVPEIPQDGRDLLMNLAEEASFETSNARAYGDIVVQLDGKEYEKAIVGINRLPNRSLYYKKLAPQIPEIRAKLKAVFVLAIDKAVHERDLQKALDLIAKAQDISDTLDQDLYHKKLLCQRNIDDSKRLADARDLVKAGKIAEARTTIKAIDAKSFCYQDAAEVLLEVERNQLSHDAAQLYREGEGEQALEKIRSAKQRTTEMDALAQKIESVLKLYEAGQSARNERDFRASRGAGQSLVSLEPDPENFYHMAGLELQSETPYELASRSLKAAREARAANDFPGERAKYEEALGHMPGQKEALEGLKKLSEATSREYNRVINDKEIAKEKLLARLKEIRQWVGPEDRLARAIDGKIKELEGK